MPFQVRICTRGEKLPTRENMSSIKVRKVEVRFEAAFSYLSFGLNFKSLNREKKNFFLYRVTDFDVGEVFGSARCP